MDKYRYERKFFVENKTAIELDLIVKNHPYFFKEIFKERFINNIYFDTPNLSNYYANVDGNYNRRKVRIRWYGNLLGEIENPKLEIKIKQGELGNKIIHSVNNFILNNEIYKNIIFDLVDNSNLIDQINILHEIADKEIWKLTHVKPHGALNNMACENYDLSITIGEAIKECNPDLIYLILPLTEMENAAKKLNIKYASEIFADRNYDDNGLLLPRHNNNSMVNNTLGAINNVKRMIESKSIFCYSGKRIQCEFDSICIHGDGKLALDIAKSLYQSLIRDGFTLKPLNQLNKFK